MAQSAEQSTEEVEEGETTLGQFSGLGNLKQEEMKPLRETTEQQRDI